MHRIFHGARIFPGHGAGDPGVRHGAVAGGSAAPGGRRPVSLDGPAPAGGSHGGRDAQRPQLRLMRGLDDTPVPRTMNHAVGGVRDQPDPAPRPGLVRAALPGRGAGRGLGTAVRRDQRGRRRLRAGPPGARRRGVTGLRGGR